MSIEEMKEKISEEVNKPDDEKTSENNTLFLNGGKVTVEEIYKRMIEKYDGLMKRLADS